MGFIYPQLLWILVAILPMMMLWNFAQRRRERKLADFAVKETWPILNKNVSSRARFHKVMLLLLALSLSVVAAARPYWGTTEREVKKTGLNIIFAIDVSNSMLATDDIVYNTSRSAPTTRLQQARTVLREFLALSPGHRIGVMPFAGEPFLQCPLTTDYSNALDVVETVNVDAVSVQGTDIPAVIDASIDAFERSGEGNRLLILITDGEDHSAQIATAADRAQEEGLTIFALGIGSSEGAPIILPNGNYKEDENGRKVISKLNIATLRDLAERTGGAAYASDEGGNLNVRPLVRDIESIGREELSADRRVVREERFQWPLALALMCLVAESLIGERRRKTAEALSGGRNSS